MTDAGASDADARGDTGATDADAIEDLTDLYREYGNERLPPGQRETDRFPVLSKSGTPSWDPRRSSSRSGARSRSRSRTRCPRSAISPR